MFFNAGIYLRLYETPLGQALWLFLQEPEIIIRLKRASELDQPALKRMGQRFLDRFGDEVNDDFTKQMIGKMVKQLLESEGYTFVLPNRTFRNDPLFSSSARYALG